MYIVDMDGGVVCGRVVLASFETVLMILLALCERHAVDTMETTIPGSCMAFQTEGRCGGILVYRAVCMVSACY